MEGLFTVIPVNGEAVTAGDPYTESLRYDGLTWEDAIELVRLSFMQGFEVIIWKIDGEAEEDAECGAEA